MSDSIVIVGAARTPMGAFQGDFAALAASEDGESNLTLAISNTSGGTVTGSISPACSLGNLDME